MDPKEIAKIIVFMLEMPDSVKMDHIVVNKNPPLKRPIILVNLKKLSNAVRLNLIRESEINEEEFEGIF